ncbi:MAG TPA: hypothetical protein VGK74_13215 [Symbiobacteriaceae bacterium]|jgi:hypothetical protein
MGSDSAWDFVYPPQGDTALILAYDLPGEMQHVGRQPTQGALRKDVLERLRKVRAKFAELKYHDFKPNRRLPDITEVVQVIASRLQVSESTLWSDKAPYLKELKRLLAVWEKEFADIQNQDGQSSTAGEATPRNISRQQALDALKVIQEETRALKAQLARKVSLVQLLEGERTVLETELDRLRGECTALERTLAHQKAAVASAQDMQIHETQKKNSVNFHVVEGGGSGDPELRQALQLALGRAEASEKVVGELRLHLLAKRVVSIRDRLRRFQKKGGGSPLPQTD